MALCVGFSRAGDQILYRPPAPVPKTLVQEFAKEQIGNVESGDYYEFEYNLDMFLEDTDYSWDEVHQAMLEEAINDSDFESIDYLLKRMDRVKFLRDLDLDRKGSWPVPDNKTVYEHFWGSIDTPFVCYDPDIMDLMLRYYDKRDETSQYVMWTDSKKICMKAVSLDEAAMAAADHQLYEMIDAVTGGWGWVDQECVFLSDDVDLVQKHSSKRIMLDMDSEAMYWMSEAPSLIIAERTDSDASNYDIRKILKAANPVFLAKYLLAYKDIDKSVINSWKAELRSGNDMKLTVEMFRDLCDTYGCCCMPYSKEWMSDRRESCLRILKEYESGVRSFYEPEEEDDYGWDDWDDDNTYEKLPDENYTEW